MTPHRTIISSLVLLAAIVCWTPRHVHAVELLVSDPGANGVLRYNIETKAFNGVFASGGGLTEPSGLTFGPDGNLYVGGAISKVLRCDGAAGEFIDSFVPGFSGGLLNPNDLVFGPDGNLYVGSGAFTGKVLRYDGATGEFIDTFASGGGLSLPGGLAFGPDGNLYVSSPGFTTTQPD